MKVYFDNAATTPLDPEVFEAMKPFMLEDFGNPSSTHAHGRKVRAAIESARKKIAELLNCTPGEIIFTSGGTEADNTILVSGIQTYGIKHAISTPIEHHAVSHTLEILAKKGIVQLHHVSLTEKGHVDGKHLEELLISECVGIAYACQQRNRQLVRYTASRRVNKTLWCLFSFRYGANHGALCAQLKRATRVWHGGSCS
jgi:cysteine sulfinate desulfinase/cysteine desulfurase-like protein